MASGCLQSPQSLEENRSLVSTKTAPKSARQPTGCPPDGDHRRLGFIYLAALKHERWSSSRYLGRCWFLQVPVVSLRCAPLLNLIQVKPAEDPQVVLIEQEARRMVRSRACQFLLRGLLSSWLGLGSEEEEDPSRKRSKHVSSSR